MSEKDYAKDYAEKVDVTDAELPKEETFGQSPDYNCPEGYADDEDECCCEEGRASKIVVSAVILAGVIAIGVVVFKILSAILDDDRD